MLLFLAMLAPPEPVAPIPIKTGNLSVGYLMATARGQTPPAPQRELDYDALRRIGVSSIEDYVSWLCAEPERDRWDWAYYQNNATELDRAGLGYTVYPWLHFPPAWAPDSELWEPHVQLGSGRTTWSPSIWSPRTIELFDRFYARLRHDFGDRIEQIYVSLITDYGEVGYPIGLADWVVPAEFKGPGFWCGDALARADFRAKMIARHGDLERLNAAWGTAFAEVDTIDYPAEWATEGPDPAAVAALPAGERGPIRRRWLDFVEWYLEAMVEFTQRAVATVRRHFPDVPCEVKIGFGSERVCYGADYTHFLARSRADGYTVRSTHGKLPPFFYRRFSTAARHYGARLVTEPPSDVSRDEEVERIFKDASSGTSEYMDYPRNLLDAADLFARYGRYLEGQHSVADLALFFPTTDHRLRPGQANPIRLWDTCVLLRDLLDFDLVDERLVRDGALAAYDHLAIVEGTVIPADVLAALADWEAGGGRLLIVEFGPIETVDGATEPGDRLRANAVRIPNGDARAIADALAAALPAGRRIDGHRDGVWIARLPNRVLLYNSVREPRAVTIATPAGERTVSLPPISLGSVELPSGEVLVP